MRYWTAWAMQRVQVDHRGRKGIKVMLDQKGRRERRDWKERKGSLGIWELQEDRDCQDLLFCKVVWGMQQLGTERLTWTRGTYWF